jgi:hypothetical protein
MIDRRVFALLFIAGVIGCGGSGLNSQVTGKVTLDSQPLTKGTVTFAPKGAEGRIAYGEIDGSGNYTLKTNNEAGVMAGEYDVTARATGVAPKDDVPPPLLTPEKYGDKATSGWTFTVKPGANTINLDMVK